MKPSGYAVVMSTGDFVGIWRTEESAQAIVNRSQSVKDERIEPMLFLRELEALQMPAIAAELARAVSKFPTWPTDPLHALAVLGEEFGELTKAMLQFTYEPHKTSIDEIRTEALQTAAMALRLYRSLDRYEYRPAPQHSQETQP